jgi:hypothetical protein
LDDNCFNEMRMSTGRVRVEDKEDREGREAAGTSCGVDDDGDDEVIDDCSLSSLS